MAVTPAEALRHKLVNAAAVKAIIGTRLYSRLAPADATLPLGTMQTISQTSDYHMGGMTGLGHAVVQVNWFAAGTDTLMDLANKARLAVGNFTGAVTVGEETINLRCVKLQGQIEDFDNPWDGSDAEAPRVIQEWSMVYVEAATAS